MKTWLASRNAMVAAVVLSLALASLSLVPALGGRFVTDDQGFRAVTHSTSEHAPPAWDLFRFQRGDELANAYMIRTGHLAWWAAPDLRIHFARPLTSLLFVADDAVFGDAAVGYHLHSLLWFALMLVGAAVFFGRVLDPAAAVLALLIFGIAGAHTDAFAWISARHALIGGAGVAWALAIGSRGGRWHLVALLPLVVGLLGSESALGGVPLLAALAWSKHERRFAIPAVVVGVVYLAVYVVLGFGTRASGGYHDPLTDPVGYLAVAITRLPILLGDATLSVPSELAFVVSPVVLALIGLVGIGVVVWAWRGPRDRTLVWLVAGGVVALLPGLAGVPAGRVLVVPDLAFAAVLGSVLATRWRAPMIILALTHFVIAPLAEVAAMHRLAKKGAVTERVAADIQRLVPAGSRAILVEASDPYVFLYARGVLAETAPGAVSCWSVLSAAPSRHDIKRLDNHTLSIETVDRPMLSGFDALFRDPASRPMHVGDTMSQCGGDIRVEAVNDGRPTKITVTYKRRLDDPTLTFLVAHGTHVELLD
ncbi:MAG TPA: hypothetical protein VGM39_09595 [Kofleriaceae bacterium]